MSSETPSKIMPSGSGWDINELERFRFVKEPTRYALQDFPWNDLLPDDGIDPFTAVSSNMEVVFGVEAKRSPFSSTEADAKRFYNALDCLKGQPGEPETVNIRRMRSKRNFDSSSPMTPISALQMATADGRSSHEGGANSSTQAASRNASHGVDVKNDTSTPKIESGQSSVDTHGRSLEQSRDTDQSPIAAYLKRRRLSFRAQEEIMQFEGNAIKLFIPTNSVLDAPNREEECNSVLVPGPAAISQSPQKSSTPEDSSEETSETPLAIPFSEQHFPSSQTDPTYRESSTFSTETLSNPRMPDPYENQAEESTNYMMRLLLDIVCEMLNKRPNSPGIIFKVSHDIDTLFVPIGKGDFIKTRPDLKITIALNGKTMTILDYEGKRLKPNMTTVQKFAQRVSHMIGRARHNMDTMATSIRTVYLITAQHSCVSVVSCSLKRKWLDMIAEDLDLLNKYAEQTVLEYGPADIFNPDERMSFVKVLTRLLVHLMERSKFGQSLRMRTKSNINDEKASTEQI